MTISKNLILVGGGGHCKSVIEVAESAGYNILGILDLPENVGKKIFDYSIVGTDDNITDYIQKAFFIVTVGQIKSPKLRALLHDEIVSVGGRLATLVASTAYVSKYAMIGEGTVLMHHSFVNAEVKIGRGCIINTYANIEHDVQIGDYCHISTGAMVNGNCIVGDDCFIGSNTVLVNGISIEKGCVIAAGSVIRKSICRRGVYSGHPATLKIKLD